MWSDSSTPGSASEENRKTNLKRYTACHVHACVCAKLLQSCPTLCHSMHCSLPGRLHGILQARILGWVAIPFSRGSFWPKDWTQVSRIAGRCFTIWVTRKTHVHSNIIYSSQDMGATSEFITRWMGNKEVVYIYIRNTTQSLKKKWNLAICSNMDSWRELC